MRNLIQLQAYYTRVLILDRALAALKSLQLGSCVCVSVSKNLGREGYAASYTSYYSLTQQHAVIVIE